MVSIALINLPSAFLVDDKIMPPLGVMYLSSYLKSKGIKTEIIDLAVRDMHESDVKRFDIIAYSSTTPQYHYIADINRQKEINPKCTFVIGGAHATIFKDKCRLDGFDSVVDGEGEEALYSIAKFVECEENNRIFGVVKGRQIPNIDEIPFPDRNFDGFEKYKYKLDGCTFTTMITSRGCPFECYFCCKTWNGVRLRSAKNVIEEVKVIKELGFDGVFFYDDTFTVNRKRILDICKDIKNLDMKWRCFIHANTVDEELLRIMYNSGCVELGIGVESGSPKILKTINKKIDINKVIQIFNWCHKIGLRIKPFLIIGLPGESRETVNETISFLRRVKPDGFTYSIYTPFPNTEIWNNTKNFDIKFDKNNIDYSKMYYQGISGKYKCQVSTSHLTSKEIEALRDYVDIEMRKEIFT